MYVIFAYGDNGMEWNTSEWRQLAPCDAMNRVGGDWRGKMIHVSGFEDYLNPVIQDLVAPCDIIIFQRNIISQDAIDAIQYWQGMGKAVAVDLDDAYHMLPHSNPAHKFWHKINDGEATQWLAKGLSLSDGLVSPNRLLLMDYSHLTKGYYVQNYARREWWTGLKDRATIKHEWGLENRIVIGWGGSVSHYDSWWGSGIRVAAERITRRHSNVTWLICGNDPRIVDLLDISTYNKGQFMGVPAQEWPQIVKGFDIGVAPLEGPYDQRRSWIKGCEYVLGGVPWVGTHGEPYKDIPEQWKTLVRNNPNEWERAIERVIDNLAHEQERLNSVLEEAQQFFFIDTNLHNLKGAYDAIINDRRSKRARLGGIQYVNWGREPGFSSTSTPIIRRNVDGSDGQGKRGIDTQGALLRSDSGLECETLESVQ